MHGDTAATHKSQPYFDLPIVVRHVVDEQSPLKDCIFNCEEMTRRGYEFVLLVEFVLLWLTLISEEVQTRVFPLSFRRGGLICLRTLFFMHILAKC
jgi:hypothetical protein